MEVAERAFCPTLFFLVARTFKTGQKPLWSWVPVGLTQSQLFCLEIPSLEPLGKINFINALMLAGGAKPATHYLQSHKHLCSIAFGVNSGLEPVTVSILPPASAADSPLLFKRIQCYKSSIWLSAGPSHDLVLNKSGHESINTALWF